MPHFAMGADLHWVKKYDEKLRRLSLFFKTIGVSSLSSFFLKKLHGIRFVYYHGLDRRDIGVFSDHLKYFNDTYQILKVKSENAITDFLSGDADFKNGLVITFDDGLYSQLWAADLLNNFGIEGIFFVPSGVLQCMNRGAQENFAEDRAISLNFVDPEDEVFLSLDDVRHISQRHIIGSHTIDHTRLPGFLDNDFIFRQLLQSREDLRSQFPDLPIEHFAWVGGEAENYPAQASQLLQSAGYNLGYTTLSSLFRRGDNPLMINRTNLETRWSLDVVKFQLSGIQDIRALFRRASVRSRYS